LLLRQSGLVKTIKFKKPRYIGDPINAVRLFNDQKADELVFLDILASRESRTINPHFVEKVGDEADMPFGVGGGIRSIQDIRDITSAGAEKVIINTYAAENPEFIKHAAEEFGSSTISVSIDLKRRFVKNYQVYTLGGSTATGRDPLQFAKLMETMGAGELIINSIDRDGTMEGFDIALIQSIADLVSIPVVALGGCADLDDMKKARMHGHASAVAAGSLFVFHGPRRAVLINYPPQKTLYDLFDDSGDDQEEE